MHKAPRPGRASRSATLPLPLPLGAAAPNAAGQAMRCAPQQAVVRCRVVQFLQDHDPLARQVAANGQSFAATHLVTEGRLCYIKVGHGRGAGAPTP